MFQDNISFYTYMLVVCALLGACMGSFLNCFAWRIVHNESILKGRSHCDYCEHVLGFMDLIPIVSYIIHGGKCRWCGQKLSSRHLWGEIVSALVFATTFFVCGFSISTLEGLLFASILLGISFADLEDYLIPDQFIYAGIVIRVVFILVSGNIKTEFISSIIGGITVAGGILLVVLIFEKIIGREAMGGGDIRLLIVTGMYLGWQRNILAVLIACVVGIIFGIATQKARNEDEENEDPKIFPFGPSIAIGAWISFLFGYRIIYAYLSLF